MASLQGLTFTKIDCYKGESYEDYIKKYGLRRYLLSSAKFNLITVRPAQKLNQYPISHSKT